MGTKKMFEGKKNNSKLNDWSLSLALIAALLLLTLILTELTATFLETYFLDSATYNKYFGWITTWQSNDKTMSLS